MSMIRKYSTSDGEMLKQLKRLKDEGTADPAVRRLAEEAVAKHADMSEIQAVHAFVRETFPYANDPVDAELFIHPKVMAEDYYSGRTPRSGDCDDHSLLVSSMLGSIGYRTRITVADTDSDLMWDHAYAQVFSEIMEQWVNVDTTSDVPLGWTFHTWMETHVE